MGHELQTTNKSQLPSLRSVVESMVACAKPSQAMSQFRLHLDQGILNLDRGRFMHKWCAVGIAAATFDLMSPLGRAQSGAPLSEMDGAFVKVKSLWLVMQNQFLLSPFFCFRLAYASKQQAMGEA